MGYSEYLRELLRPLGVYALEESLNGAELDAEGAVLDGGNDEITLLERESSIITAEDFALLGYEEILPKHPISPVLTERRAAINALLRIDEGSFTPGALSSTIAGCGINAEVREGAERYTLEISFPDERGMPSDFEELKNRIEEILPCHLGYVYAFVYLSWRELMEKYGFTWRTLEARNLTWRQFEKL